MKTRWTVIAHYQSIGAAGATLPMDRCKKSGGKRCFGSQRQADKALSKLANINGTEGYSYPCGKHWHITRRPR